MKEASVIIDEKGITITNGSMRMFDNGKEIKCYSVKEDDKQ